MSKKQNDNQVDLKLDKLIEYLKAGEQRVQKKINKNDIVLVIGNTGAGKFKYTKNLIQMILVFD